MSNLEFSISCCCHFWLQFRYVVGTVVCFNFTSGPSGRTGRLWAAATGRHWRRSCRRRVSALLLSDYGLRIRGLVRIRARIRVLCVVLAADRRAIEARAAGPVEAARSAAVPLPRAFSLLAQVLVRQTRVWLSCLQALLPRRRWPGPPSASWRRLCWRWRSGGPRPPPIRSRRPR
jgi:hypothetical protein